MTDWMTRAVLRTKQALGSSPPLPGTGGGNTAAAPKLPTGTPKLPTSTPRPPGISSDLMNQAAANYNKLKTIPKPPPAVKPPSGVGAAAAGVVRQPSAAKPATAPQQSDLGTRASQKLMSQFSADPRGYMQSANQSGPMGGFLGAASLFNHDAVNTMLGGKDVGEEPGFFSRYDGGALDLIPGVAGAKMLTRPIDNALGHAWNGNWGEAGKQFYDADYNRRMGDSSRSYLDRAMEASGYSNFYKNTTGVLGGLAQGDTWKGLGINLGLLSDNNGG